MYELVRSKGKSNYVIAKNSDNGSDGRHRRVRAGGEMTFSGEIDKATWKEYVLTGNSGREPVKPHISDSWKRCLDMGVDPASGKCSDIRPEKELGAEYHLLKELAGETEKDIYTLIKGKGLLITICDRHGYLVNMCGDYKALLSADRLNFGPGANWSEKSVGTNAIGTAMTCGRAMQVAGREHFCESHHRWICSAAPIFDLDGDTIGCIDISGPKTADHTHALALAIEGARAIEHRLFHAQSVNLINTVFSVVMTGLVYIDLNGKIRAANPAAAILLATPANRLTGADARRWFDLNLALHRLKHNPAAGREGGVGVGCLGIGNCDARALPIVSPNQKLSGIVLVIRELQSVMAAGRPAPAAAQDAFGAVIGASSAMRLSIDKARRVAATPTTVLITGESGTGKEIMARALHDSSPRRTSAFVAVNCGAIAPELIQSELFGYVEGAFTGACRGGRTGKFEQASGGTLFLDEIGAMPLSLQVNLLRVLEEKKVTRVGGKIPIAVDLRIIAATNQDLEEMAAQGGFRRDLFYRLNVVRITLPPLKARGDDIRLLAGHFIDIIAAEIGRTVRRVDASFFQCLAAYDWPGNIRELRHAIESAITLMDGDVLRRENLPEPICTASSSPKPAPPLPFDLEEVQRQTIHRAHVHFQGNISRMARALGIGRNTLYAKLKKYQLS